MESCEDNPGYDPWDERDAPEPDDYDVRCSQETGIREGEAGEAGG